jgi:hypothetical protein
MVCKDGGQEPLAITFSRVDEKAPTKKPLTKGAFLFNLFVISITPGSSLYIN